MMNKCVYCNHSNLCKYRQEYEKVLAEITVKVPEPFSLVLNCKHYYDTTCTLNRYYSDCANSANALSCSPAGGDSFVY